AGPENGGPENSGPQRTSPVPTRPPGYGVGGYGPAGSGAQRVLGPGTGPQRLSGSGSGAQPALGAPAPFPGTGSAGSAGRTPVRGFPPKRAPAEPFLGGPAEDAYPGDDSYLDDRLAPADGEGQRAGPGR